MTTETQRSPDSLPSLKAGVSLGDTNNPNWQGGITPQNRLDRTSNKYIDWRKAVFERDNYTCQMCGDRGVTLHADHIKPFAYHPELRFDVNNGRALCVPCHKTTDTYTQRVKRNKYKEKELAFG